MEATEKRQQFLEDYRTTATRRGVDPKTLPTIWRCLTRI
jgi:hypothetical protein